VRSWTSITLPADEAHVSLGGIRVRSILSAELAQEAIGGSPFDTGGASELAAWCHGRWTDLADTLAAMPEPIEAMVILASNPEQDQQKDEVSIVFLGLARAATAPEAERKCASVMDSLWTLLVTILDYLELEAISELEVLNALANHLRSPCVTEIRRRMENIRVSHGVIEYSPVGFEKRHQSPPRKTGTADIQITQLFPWVPSDDTWRRLMEALVHEHGDAALVVHLCGLHRAPEASLNVVRDALVETEKIASSAVDSSIETLLARQAEVIREETLQRLAILEGRLLGARVFITASASPSSALIATVAASIDDASVRQGQAGADLMFRGGARLIDISPGEVLAPFCELSLDLLFGPMEASAIVRTPIPPDRELPGVQINRARTAAIVGISGEDAPLGYNIHRGLRLPVALDDFMRFRHTYIVGQTGTGKSTLLLHMILHDIRRGRGVAVLDPHGTLIDHVLLHYPWERSEDLVIVDVTDVDRPVGFNVLALREQDPLQYRIARDLVIDDLYSYIDRTYDLKMTGGPMFETHLRGMLGLLLGVEPQVSPLIPNLMVFRSLYTNKNLRNALVERAEGKDLMIDDFITEIINVSGEASLQNMAPYITSKFNRFVSDLSLRNITCQASVLDLDEVVNKGKVLLFYLGKGRFGDQAAGLLASQIVSRIRGIAMKRDTTAEHVRPFYLYADEFQLFADERFTELLAEARKFKLSLTIAHQYVQQIPEKVLQGVLGNVGTTAVFRVGALDGEFLESLFKPTFNQRDLTSLANFRAYVRSFGALGHTPFSVEMEGPLNGGDPERAETLRQLSRTRHGRDREAVDEEIRATYEAYKSLHTAGDLE